MSQLFDAREQLAKLQESQRFLRQLVFAVVSRYGDEHGNLRLDSGWDEPLSREPIILTHTDIETGETIVRAKE